VDLELRCSQPAAAACGRLVLVDLGDGSTTTHVSNRLLGCQVCMWERGGGAQGRVMGRQEEGRNVCGWNLYTRIRIP
jgi:hypothetical protein